MQNSMRILHFVFILGLLSALAVTAYWSTHLTYANEMLYSTITDLEQTNTLTNDVFQGAVSEADSVKERNKNLSKENKAFSEAAINHQKNKMALEDELASMQAKVLDLEKMNQSQRLAINTLEQLNKDNNRLAHLLLAESEFDRALTEQALQSSQLAFDETLSEQEKVYKDLALSYEQLSLIKSELLFQIHAQNNEMELVEQQLAETKVTLDKEREINTTTVFSDGVKKGADLKVLLRERERLIATNKELVKRLNQNQKDERALHERTSALESELLSLSHQLRAVKLAQFEEEDELLANRE